MKAVRIHTFGGSDVLTYEDTPDPKPAADEVLIKTLATSVNPWDSVVRSGYANAYMSFTLPLTLGTDVSGEIVEVGAGVTQFKPGDQVYSRAGVTRDGSHAQYVTVPVSDVAFKPRSIDHIHAAALPHVSLTAWRALIELADLKEGQTVLIHGAAGGVGHIAVQLAQWRGAKVIGTASRNIDLLRELQVDQAINYSTTAFESLVRDVDVVLDTIGGDTQERSWSVLKPGGILISTIQQPSEEQAAAHGVRQAMIYNTPNIGKVLTQIAALVDAGVIKPHISEVLSLTDIQEAHQMVDGKHTRGKIVMQVQA